MPRRPFGPRSAAGAALLLAALAATPASAQVVYPPKPDKYAAAFRYRIRAGEQDRVRQYRALEKAVRALGFEPAEREDADLAAFDPTVERMDGTIPSAGAARLVDTANVVTAVLVPAGVTLPDDGKKPVPVRIRLSTGLAAREQALLHRQVVAHLGLLGFAEGVAYDTAGFTLVRGSLPAENLYTLLDDLRFQPAGWFAPAVPLETLPSPLRSVTPIRLVEVLPDAAAPAPVAPPPVGSATSPKLTVDAQAAVADPANQGKPVRVDLVLEDEPGLAWRDTRVRIRTVATSASVEGLVGNVATVRVAAGDVAKLATLPEVRSIRLPRVGAETIQPGAGGADPASWLAPSHVADLHRLGYRGAGVRVVVVGSDFPGAGGLVGKRLPPTTRLVDLTAELNPDIRPLPPIPGRSADGISAALAAAAAAPGAEVILVRVDPTVLSQLETVARVVAGDSAYSEAMQSRSAELISKTDALAARRVAATNEYRAAFADLSDEDAPTRRRAAAAAAFDKLTADEQALKETVERFAALKAATDSLRGSGVVVNTLVWDAGYPLDGLSDLSRLIDDKFAPKPVTSALRALRRPPTPVWVQAASRAVGQVWAGPFRDADGNGVMEFAAPVDSVPPGAWTRELNFLGFAPADGAPAAALPAGLKLRVTVQWREPHDLDAGYTPDVVLPFTLRLLRQLDPDGKSVASDEFAEVARSVGPPVRLLKTTASAAFEQTLEVTVPADGVYALRIEGRAALDGPFLPKGERIEVAPRVALETTDPASAAKGRPVFRTFPATAVGVGIPGDAPAAVTVGVERSGAPATLTGVGPGVVLATKPDLVAPAALTVDGTNAAGSGVAAGYAAGTAASLMSAGVRANELVKALGLTPGQPLVLPKPWLDTLRPRAER